MDIEKIYNEYFKIIYQYVLSLSRNPELSEDIAQETFLKALKRVDELEDGDNVKGWLCKIARNTYYKHYNSEKRYEKIISETNEESYDPGPEAVIIKTDERVRLYRLIHSLEEPYREVFSLRSTGELSFKEIGIIFGKTENWARVTYHRARKKLLEVISNEDEL